MSIVVLLTIWCLAVDSASAGWRRGGGCCGWGGCYSSSGWGSYNVRGWNGYNNCGCGSCGSCYSYGGGGWGNCGYACDSCNGSGWYSQSANYAQPSVSQENWQQTQSPQPTPTMAARPDANK